MIRVASGKPRCGEYEKRATKGARLSLEHEVHINVGRKSELAVHKIESFTFNARGERDASWKRIYRCPNGKFSHSLLQTPLAPQ